MNARLEFKGNFLEISGFAHCPGDMTDYPNNYNQYNSSFWLAVKSGDWSGRAVCEYDITGFREFISELERLRGGERSAVKLSDLTYCTNVEFVRGMEMLTLYGTVGDGVHSLEFEFEVEQIGLPAFIAGLHDMIKEYEL